MSTEKPVLPSNTKGFAAMKPPSVNKIREASLIFLKLFIGICLLPICYAATLCFIYQLLNLQPSLVSFFTWGMAGFAGFYFIVWEADSLFKRSQRMLEASAQFFAPFFKVAPYLFPMFTVLLFCAYFIFSLFTDTSIYLNEFMFLAGFSYALHIAFCAKTLRNKPGDKFKAGYIFGFSLLYILNALLLAFFFNLTFQEFSFLKFFNGACQITKEIYIAVFRQLFL